ncbi:MAG TPA: CHAT domain-containing protein [Spirillospora sp.]|nr:CHAT domain-containing protein [Spirillospora sp.]
MSAFAEIDDYLGLLRTSLLAAPTGTQAEAGLHLELAWTLADRYDSPWRRDGDLAEIIGHAEAALRTLDRGYEQRAEVLGLAARARAARWHAEGAPADRDAVVEHRRTQVAVLADDHPDLPEALAELAEALVSRALDTEGPAQAADLEAGLLHARRASAIAGDGDPAELLRYVLGHGLALRFDLAAAAEVTTAKQAGELRADRDAAIEQFSALHASLPGPSGDDDDDDDPEARYEVAEKLAELLYDRYNDAWPDAPPPDLGDLDRAIGLLTACGAGVDIAPPGMLTLGDAHADRYAASSDPADLDGALTWLDRVLPEARDGLAARIHASLGDLRHQRAGLDPPPDRLADLAAAAAHFEAARDGAEQEWHGMLSALLTMARADVVTGRDGEPTEHELDQIVESASRAWEELPPDDELRVPSGLWLGVALHDLMPFARHPPDELARVTRAVDVLTEVEPEYRDDAEKRVTIWTMLGMLLAGRGQLRGDADDMRAALPWLSRALPELDLERNDVTVRNVALAMATCGVYGGFDEQLGRAADLLRRMMEDPRTSRLPWLRGTLGAVLGARADRFPEVNDEAIELLRASVADLPQGDPDRLVVLTNLASALERRHNRSQSSEDLEAAGKYREAVREHLRRHPEAARGLPGDTVPITTAGLGQVAVVRGVLAGDRALIERGTAEMRSALAALPDRHPMRSRMRTDIGLGLAAQGVHGPGGDRLSLTAEAAGELSAGIADVPPGHPLRPYVLLRAMAILAYRAAALRDPTLLKKVLEYAEMAIAEPAANADVRTRATLARADLLVVFTIMDRDPAHAREAVAEFERVLADDAVRPGPEIEARLYSGFARALRQSGDEARAREAGRRAMAAFGTVVLLQSGTDHAFQRAGAVADLGDDLVNWCLDDGEPAEAVAALELGRGLVLHAATVAADVPAMLAEAGEAVLAAEWREASARTEPLPWERPQRAEDLLVLPAGQVIEVPSGLRGRVLEALEHAGAGARLRNPPAVPEIAAALAATDADALVFLRPPVGGRCAQGIVVFADGTVSTVPFPLFSARMTDAIEDYLADRERLARVHEAEYPDEDACRAAEDAALRRWRRSLGMLCDWAWPMVVRPLLRHVTARTGPGRPPRLVLVPIGALGVIPWHAARRRPRRPGPAVYACAEAVVSYAASARQLIDVSRRSALDLHESPLIVGDPSYELPLAIEEAVELRRRYYGGAHYLGFPEGLADGPGTPAEVRGRLATADRPGASMIHMGCHAYVVADRPGESFLLLGGGQRLKVEQLLRAAHGRDPRAPGARVSLAACMSDLAGGRQDEALTLATAFIAAGAATVVGARWEVPDETSPLLMLKYHEFLNAGERPCDALRLAQLWMLDPGRRALEGLPDALQRVIDEEGQEDAPALDDIAGWAAFTHQGL